jgi:nucleoside-diphosphate kinase
MTVQKTFCIVKPDAVKNKKLGAILSQLEESGFNIVAGKLTKLTTLQAEKFYEVHKARPFYGELVAYMTSGTVFVSVLEAENAVLKYRDLMGATDPKNAAEGTIRARFGTSIEENAVHGSDSLENASLEIGQFFPECL